MYSNQTEIGKIFNIDSHEVAKLLVKLGLKVDNKPSQLAIRANLVKKDKVWLWDKEEIIKLFSVFGLKKTGAAGKNEKKLAKLDKNTLVAFVDGSDITYAVVLFDRHNIKHYIAGKENLGNNNRAELKAVSAVLTIIPESESVTIVTDSMYVKRTMDYIAKRFNKNLDLIKPIKLLLASKHIKVKTVWVKSHTALHGNEEVDALATFVKTLTL